MFGVCVLFCLCFFFHNNYLNGVEITKGNVGGMNVGHHWAVQDIFMSYGVGVHPFGGGAIRQVAARQATVGCVLPHMGGTIV